MTPDRRLDQLEPLMADSLQKIDRLIEGQGQLIEVATRADQNADTAARGVANLTVSTQQQFEQLKAGQDELRSNMELILQILREKLPENTKDRAERERLCGDTTVRIGRPSDESRNSPRIVSSKPPGALLLSFRQRILVHSPSSKCRRNGQWLA